MVAAASFHYFDDSFRGRIVTPIGDVVSGAMRPSHAGGASVGDGDAHGPGGPGDDVHRGVDVVGVQVGHLGLGDLLDLGLADLADGLQRVAGALLQAGGLLGMSLAAGGVLVMKSKDRSSYTVISTGITCRAGIPVAAL